MHLASEAIAEACRLPVRAALCAVVAAGCALVANGAPVAFKDAAWLRYCTACVERYKDVVDEWEIWNEPFNQAKWNLRRAIGDASRSIPSSVFTLIDLQYTFMLQSFGLIRSNTLKEFVYRRPSYYAMQNVYAIFDDDTRALGHETAKTVELPAGRWRDDLGETHVGPKTLRLEDVPLARLPHYELRSK